MRAREISKLCRVPLLGVDEDHQFAVIQCPLHHICGEEIETLRRRFSEEDLDMTEEVLPPHVTIFYGLKDFHLSDLQEALKDFGELEFTMMPKPKVFDNPRHDVLFLPIESTDFKRLHTHIGRLTGVAPPTYKTYIPHCTVAFLKKGVSYSHASLSKPVHGRALSLEFLTTTEKPYLIELV